MKLLRCLCLRAAGALFDLAGWLEERELRREREVLLPDRLTPAQYRDFCRARRQSEALRPNGVLWFWTKDPEARA